MSQIEEESVPIALSIKSHHVKPNHCTHSHENGALKDVSYCLQMVLTKKLP